MPRPSHKFVALQYFHFFIFIRRSYPSKQQRLPSTTHSQSHRGQPPKIQLISWSLTSLPRERRLRNKNNNNNYSHYLACQDNKLAQSLQEIMPLKCQNNEATQAVFRGIRQHYVHLLRNDDFKEKDLLQAQLGLAHSVSRNKVKLDINREDKHITQAICIVEQ